jgi:hypothetical protein
MAIDVMNHIWVNVFAASYVQQHAEETRRVGSPGSALESAARFVEEAAALADVALEEYRQMYVRQQREHR